MKSEILKYYDGVSTVKVDEFHGTQSRLYTLMLSSSCRERSGKLTPRA
jgi:hypothetical protein